MSRREFPAKIRAAAFERAAGCCERCTANLMPSRFAYDLPSKGNSHIKERSPT